MQLRPTIHLYFEDGRYVAIVPDHPGCHAYGASYAQALENLELLLCRRFEHGIDARSEAGSRCNSSNIRARLVAKFGKLTNRRLAASIGVVAPDAPVMLSSALGGKGSRQVRCAIALALNELPSQLWPDAAGRIRTMDDSCFLAARRGMRDASSAADEQAANDVPSGEQAHRRFS
jgi:hypothetical protein